MLRICRADRCSVACKQKGDMASMEAFGKTFDGIKFRKGLTLSFCLSGDVVTSKVRSCSGLHQPIDGM